jgi:HEAT repeat protein
LASRDKTAPTRITMPSIFYSLSVAVAVSAAAATTPDISELVKQAAIYQSGQSLEPLRELQQLSVGATADPTLRAQLESGLIRLLAPTATFEARKFACDMLAVVGSETAIPALALLLKDPDTVAMACLALGPNPSPRADAVLRDALPAARGEARLQMIHALGNRRDRQAVPLLARLAGDTDLAVAETAIIALGKIADPSARKALDALGRQVAPGLHHIVDEAVMQSAEHLVASGNPRAALRTYETILASASSPYVRRGALEALFAIDRDAGEARVLSVLRGTDSTLKPVAIARISALPQARVSQRFGRELPDLKPHEQVLLVEALARRADDGALDVIRTQLSNQNESVRTAAVHALGQLGNQDVVPLLAQALVHAGTSSERVTIERALMNLPADEATDRALLDALASSPVSVKPHLMSALAQRRSRLAVPALLDESSSPTPAVARAAFQALNRLVTATDLPSLLDRLADLKAPAARPDAETTVVRALLQVEPVGRRWKLLRPHLEQADDLELRLSLLRLLPHAPEPAALKALEAAVHDSNPSVADTAIRALADWPTLSAWDALARVYLGETAEAHRILALRALVRLAQETGGGTDAQLPRRYEELLAGAKRDEDRKLILGALGGVAHPGALSLAQAQLTNPAVRAEAELAVRQIAESLKEQHPDTAESALLQLQE